MNVLSLFDGKYEVTTDGVYSNVGNRKKLIGKVTKGGYRLLLLTVNKERKYLLEHRIIAQAFIPNPENFPQINHKDSNRLNNTISNLEWCTARNNLRHARDLKRLPRCKINHQIAEDIREFKRQHPDIGAVRLARIFPLKKSQIGAILRGTAWV